MFPLYSWPSHIGVNNTHFESVAKEMQKHVKFSVDYSISVLRYSCNVPYIFVQFQPNFDLSRHSQKSLNHILQIRPVGAKLTYADGCRAGMTKLIGAFHELHERA
jgi:hypothetical protein